MLARRAFLAAAACGCVAPAFAQTPPPTSPTGKWICPPCGCDQDGKEFDKQGFCPAEGCGMLLIPKPAEPEGALTEGRGTFEVPGGRGREAAAIGVHYYRPASFTPTSPVLLVLPGAGRNAHDYRDAWIAAADAKGLLVAALAYPEAQYDFAAYQMGGVIKNLRLPATATSGASVIRLKDEDIRFEPNPDPERWIFADFDRVFRELAQRSGTTRTTYDLFGHSAGGQILSRLVLFRPESRADRIVAANAGLYTVPDLAQPQPFGLAGAGVTEATLRAALASRLTLLLGEKDDGDEAGGIQLHTPTVDRQGIGRLSRGRYFHAAGERQAKALKTLFAWRLQTVPNVGHDYRQMSVAAAKVLYG